MTTPNEGSAYSPIPRPRRGNRRATSGEPEFKHEPRLADLKNSVQPIQRDPVELSEQTERDRWLKEQKPPHHSL